jgi:hypothetical protein
MTFLQYTSPFTQTARVFDLILPPTDIVDRIPPLAEHDIHLDACSYVLHNASDACKHLAFLLQILANLSQLAVKTYSTTPVFQDHLVWILDGVSLSCELENRWRDSRTFEKNRSAVQLQSLRTAKLLTSSNKLFYSPAVFAKSCVTLAKVCGELLRSCESDLSMSLQLEVSSSLVVLIGAFAQNESLAAVVRMDLLPLLLGYVHESEDHAVGNDFKVLIISLGPRREGS